MTAQQIQLLVLLLPANSPYFQRVFGTRPSQRPPCLSERLQLALNDPALLWNMAQSYAEANLPLPEFAWPASVRRAYDFLIDPERIDENLTQARDLQSPDHWVDRDLLRALIMCPDATPQRIAAVFGFDVEVIILFELWWNFTSRSRELLYVAQLVNGNDGDLGVRLMRVARITGKFRAVLLAAGRADPNEAGSDDELLERISRRNPSNLSEKAARACLPAFPRSGNRPSTARRTPGNKKGSEPARR